MSEEYIDFTKQIEFFKNKITKIKNYKNLEYLFLGSIMIFAFYLRTLNLKLLQGKYLLGLDPYYYLRQSTEILTYGKLPFPDLMRNAPFGIEKSFDLFPYFLAYLSKLFGFFGFTVTETHILYPSIIMVLSLIPLYFAIKLIFDKNIALLSVFILSILPAYLFRTMSGFSDHESISMFFIFLTFYFLIKSEKESKNKGYIFSSLAGFCTFLMALLWNAYPFLFIIIGSYYLLRLFFSKIDYKKYLIFLISLLIPFILFKPINFGDIGLLYLILISMFILLNEKFNFEKRINIPNIVSTLIILFFMGIIFIIFSDIISISGIMNKLLNAGGVAKVDFTTSEAISTKVMGSNGYYSQFNEFIFISFIGFIFLLNNIFSKLNKKENIILTSIFSLSVGLVIFGNWNSNIILMKDNYIYFLFAIFILFNIYYSQIYRRKDHHKINKIKNPEILLFVSYFLISGLLARTAVRFLFLMSPIVAILSGYAINKIYIKLKKNKIYSIGLIIIFAILAAGSINQSILMGKSMGSNFPGQWETSMNWISDNVEEDAIFAHWWDYGYWTQYAGKKATVSDGGRAGGDLGIYTLARYGMLGSDEQETLSYFKSRNVEYLLYSEEELYKYGAFSYIGSDINNDKKSNIGMFILTDIKEIREGNKLTYSGNWILDSEIIEGNKLINEGAAVINKISLNLDSEGNLMGEPKINLISKNFQKEYDLGCVYFNGIKILNNDKPLNYCITLIPSISANGATQELGAILLQSNKVHGTLFSELYINDKKTSNYVKVYQDNTPLAMYNGRLIGPIKIWKINYTGNENNFDRFLEQGVHEKYYPNNGIYSI